MAEPSAAKPPGLDNLDQFLARSVYFMRLPAFFGLSKKSMDSLFPRAISQVFKDLARCEYKLEFFSKNIWRAYLYFRERSEDHDGFQSIVWFFEKFLSHLAINEKEYPVLRVFLLSVLVDYDYFLSVSVKYALKYVFGEERVLADKIAVADSDYFAASLYAKPESTMGNFLDNEQFLGEMDRQLKQCKSIYGQLSVLIDFLALADKLPKLKANNVRSLICNYLVKNSVIIMELLFALDPSKARDFSPDLLKALEDFLADRKHFDRFDLEAVTGSIKFDEPSADQLLVLYLFLDKLCSKDARYYQALVLIKRVLRSYALVCDLPHTDPSFYFLFDAAAKYHFFESIGNQELRPILLSRVLNPAIHIELKPSDGEDFSESDAEEKSVGAPKSDSQSKKRRKRKKKKKEPVVPEVGLVPSPAPAPAPPPVSVSVPDEDRRSSVSTKTDSLSADCHLEVDSGDRGSTSPLDLVSVTGSESDSLKIFHQKLTELQTLRSQAAWRLNEFIKKLQDSLASLSHDDLERTSLITVLDQLKLSHQLLSTVRNSLRKSKEGEVILLKEESFSKFSFDHGMEISVWAKPYIDLSSEPIQSMIKVLELMVADDENIEPEYVEGLLKLLKMIHLPLIRSPAPDGTLIILSTISQFEERLSVFIKQFSMFYALSQAYFQRQPQTEARDLILKDMMNLWFLMNKVHHWVKLASNFHSRWNFEEVAIEPLKPDSSLLVTDDANKFIAELNAFVSHYNALVNEFALSLPKTTYSAEANKALVHSNVSGLRTLLESTYFMIHHVPLVDQLFNLLKDLCELSHYGSGVLWADRLDIDLKAKWHSALDTEAEIIGKVSVILKAHGFIVLSAEKVKFFADIISIKIRGHELNQPPVDLSIHYGRSIFNQQNHVAQAAISFNPKTGRASSDHVCFAAVREKKFLLREPSYSSSSEKKNLSDKRHVLKLLMRAWFMASRGEMGWSEEGDALKLLGQLAACSGNLLELGRIDPLLEKALVSLMQMHFSFYRPGPAYQLRSYIFLKFCQDFKFSLIVPGLGFSKVLRNIDLTYGCYDFLPEATSESKNSIIVEMSGSFWAANQAALVARSFVVSANAMFAQGGSMFSSAPVAADSTARDAAPPPLTASLRPSL